MKKSKVKNILNILAELYPEPKTALKFNNPFELLIAVILSAQTTDTQVNRVTAKLFKKYSTPEEISELTPLQLEREIKNCGLYRNKSKNIIKTCKILSKEYKGKIPDNFEELVKLPGVGRKTANVVLANAFGKNTFPVDTHVYRVSKRLGFSSGESVLAVERELCELIPPKMWKDTHHRLIYHGRNTCKARRPLCGECALLNLCKSAPDACYE